MQGFYFCPLSRDANVNDFSVTKRQSFTYIGPTTKDVFMTTHFSSKTWTSMFNRNAGIAEKLPGHLGNGRYSTSAPDPISRRGGATKFRFQSSLQWRPCLIRQLSNYLQNAGPFLARCLCLHLIFRCLPLRSGMLDNMEYPLLVPVDGHGDVKPLAFVATLLHCQRKVCGMASLGFQ